MLQALRQIRGDGALVVGRQISVFEYLREIDAVNSMIFIARDSARDEPARFPGFTPRQNPKHLIWPERIRYAEAGGRRIVRGWAAAAPRLNA